MFLKIKANKFDKTIYMLGILNKEQINNILQSQSICRLGCIDDNHVYIVPVTYFYDGNCIFAQSREGKKINLLRIVSYRVIFCKTGSSEIT